MLTCPRCGRRYAPGVQVCTVDGSRLLQVRADPYLGKVVGHYRLAERIGKGGFGVVFRAEHMELGVPFAVKVLRRAYGEDTTLVERFKREARVTMLLRHENVVNTSDFGKDEEAGFYYVMEYLEGVSLTGLMADHRYGLVPDRVIHIVEQICSALDRAHSINIVHRDLKPSNVFLISRSGDRDFVKVLDFGIAKIVLPPDVEGGFTATGQIVGSPKYMSPEQAKGVHSEIDARSDIYSLGVMVYWMLTGRPPFESKQLARILYMQVKDPPPRLADKRPEVSFPQALEDVLASALAKPKDKRPSSAGEFCERLRQALAGWSPVYPSSERQILEESGSLESFVVGGPAYQQTDDSQDATRLDSPGSFEPGIEGPEEEDATRVDAAPADGVPMWSTGDGEPTDEVDGAEGLYSTPDDTENDEMSATSPLPPGRRQAERPQPVGEETLLQGRPRRAEGADWGAAWGQPPRVALPPLQSAPGGDRPPVGVLATQELAGKQVATTDGSDSPTSPPVRSGAQATPSSPQAPSPPTGTTDQGTAKPDATDQGDTDTRPDLDAARLDAAADVPLTPPSSRWVRAVLLGLVLALIAGGLIYLVEQARLEIGRGGPEVSRDAG